MNFTTTLTSKVLLLCDHALVIEGLKAFFDRQPDLDLIRTVASCEKATAKINSDSPEVVLLNMNTHNLSEVADMVSCIRDKGYKGRIITMLSALASPSMGNSQSFDESVEGILLQTASTKELQKCLKKVMKGERYISREWLNTLKSDLSGTEEDANCSMLLSGLSDTEKTILKLIAQKKTTNEIADQLFNSPKTIENHRYRICRKLNLNGKNSLLTFVIENKNCFEEN